MRKLIMIFVAIITMAMFTSCANRIDAGHKGIKVKLYGSDKGVSDITEVTGMVWYNPFSTKVYEVPTFVQSVTYDGDYKFVVTTKDGMTASFGLAMNYLTPDESIVPIFKKYRRPLKELENGIVRTFLRDAFNNVAGGYTAEGLYEKRAEFEAAAEERARESLAKEGFVVEQIVIIGTIGLPEGVTERINDKVKAAQITKQKEEEVKQAVADANKKIAKASGDSTATVIMAQANAAAYRLQKQELNELLIKQQMIDKWDGKLPVYGQVPELFRTITK